MKILFKMAVAPFAVFGIYAAPAAANPIASPGLNAPVNINPGSITVEVIFMGPQTCSLTMAGTVTSVGTVLVPGVVKFTSGTLSGAGCLTPNFSIVYPIAWRTISTTLIRIDTLKLATPVGVCLKNNVDLSYDNTLGIATLAKTTMGICTVSAIFHTSSSQLVIAP
ncbi:hypothetical protein [Sphingomonas sp.]|uniref:hypothetical protein n=1 Tax=Sphingomonas sp. TaxID=28214 RepID=UPI003D6D6D74